MPGKKFGTHKKIFLKKSECKLGDESIRIPDYGKIYFQSWRLSLHQGERRKINGSY